MQLNKELELSDLPQSAGCDMSVPLHAASTALLVMPGILMRVCKTRLMELWSGAEHLTYGLELNTLVDLVAKF